MSQYYPQQGPSYPPEYGPEYDYYDEGDFDYYDDDEDDGPDSSLLQSAVAFFAGGCLVFLCMSLCGLVLATGWILDPGAGLSEETVPGSDIGLTFEEPAFPGEAVVNEQKMQLTILEVNRNAAIEAIPQVEGREVIIITIELLNVGDEDAPFNERDFMLLNSYEEAYAPAVGAVSGALGRGTFPPGEGSEGRLVYEVIADEVDLRLLWEPRDSAPRFLFLE